MRSRELASLLSVVDIETKHCKDVYAVSMTTSISMHIHLLRKQCQVGLVVEWPS